MESRNVAAGLLALAAVACGGAPKAKQFGDGSWDGGPAMRGDGEGTTIDAPRFGVSRPGDQDAGPADAGATYDGRTREPDAAESEPVSADAGPDASVPVKCEDSDGDGVCNFEDACPLDPLDDRDGDTVCDGVDPCPDDAPDDSDGDGVCDSDDRCEGHPDDDSDGDSKPDWCERCENGPVIDADQNGYMDACDMVLHSWHVSGENLLANSTGTTEAVFRASTGSHQDGTYYTDSSSVEVPLPNGMFSGEASTDDLSSFLDVASRPGAEVSVSVFFTGKRTLYEGDPLTGTFMRAVVRGIVSAPGPIDAVIELRGY